MRLAQTIVITLIFVIFFLLWKHNKDVSLWEEPKPLTIPEDVIDTTDVDSIGRLISALIRVESSGNDLAVNHRTDAVGCLQIRPIMVREVNRILKLSDSDKRYTIGDRIDRSRSIEMFQIWRSYHHADDSWEVLARCWNGGTRGHLMRSTIGYWNKVKRKLKDI